MVPHLSIAMGPQIAAAIHFAAAVANCDLLEFNPNVLNVANRFLAEPLECRGGSSQTTGNDHAGRPAAGSARGLSRGRILGRPGLCSVLLRWQAGPG